MNNRDRDKAILELRAMMKYLKEQAIRADERRKTEKRIREEVAADKAKTFAKVKDILLVACALVGGLMSVATWFFK